MGKIHSQSCDQIIMRMQAKLFQRRVYIPMQSLFKWPKMRNQATSQLSLSKSMWRKLWAVMKSRPTHEHAEGTAWDIWTRGTVISANWLCPKTSFSVGPLRKKFWVLSEIPIRGGKTKVMLLFQSPSCRVLVQAAGVWGALCLHSTEVSGWIFRFRVCDVQRTFLL